MKILDNENVIEISANGVNYLQFKCLLNLGVRHAYSLKSIGLDFSHAKENLETEKLSYSKLCDVVGLDNEYVVKGNQDHTNIVKVIDSIESPENLENVDGLITNKNNIILATTNADCILYMLYDKKKKIIGNIHSGWKGSYQRIIENAIDIMIYDFNSNPEDIIVCICPSIRACCFEVGKDVRDMFYKKFCFLKNIDDFILKKESKYFIDTVGINNCLLINKGIKLENIYDSGICSVCNKNKIHSYRSEGKNFKRATAIISL